MTRLPRLMRIARISALHIAAYVVSRRSDPLARRLACHLPAAGMDGPQRLRIGAGGARRDLHQVRTDAGSAAGHPAPRLLRRPLPAARPGRPVCVPGGRAHRPRGARARRRGGLRRLSPQPLATASIGQVHAAVVGGRRVAVKVQRPEVDREFRGDIRLMEGLVGLIRGLRLAPLYWLLEPLSEFVVWTREELDYRNEARFMERLRAQCRRQPARAGAGRGRRADQPRGCWWPTSWPAPRCSPTCAPSNPATW